MNKALWLIIPLLFLLAWLAGRWFLPEALQVPVEQNTLAAVWCEPQLTECVVELPNAGKLVLQIEPKDAILPMRPLRAELIVPEGWAPEAMTISGLNMDMGINRFAFSQLQPGRWKSDFLLPLCALSRMEWELRLTLRHAETVWQLPVRFVTQQ